MVKIPVTVLYNDAVTYLNSDRQTAIPGRRASTTTTKEMNLDGNMGWAHSRMGRDGYFQPGDPLLKVYETLLEVEIKPDQELDTTTRMVGEMMFEKLNIAHPDGWAHRSMSTGDVVIVGESAIFVDSFGFADADIHQSEIVEVES